jgi:hypothetical protein
MLTSGRCPGVASRLLGDYDFVIKRSAENVDIFDFQPARAS